MNTENLTNNNQVEVIAKRGPGRPRSVRKNIFLNSDFTPRKKGRVSHNSHWFVVSVDRALKNSEYVHGVTQTYGDMTEYTVPTPVESAPSNIQVTVIPAMPQSESAETQTLHESHSSQPALV